MPELLMQAPARSLRSWWDRSWVAACFLALVVASEYKWRVRPVSAGLTATLDLATVLELAVYGLVAAYLLEFRSPLPQWRRGRGPMGLLIGYTAYLCASFAWSPYPLAAGARAAETAIVLLLAWCTYRQGSLEHLRRTASWFVGLTVGSVAFGVVHPQPQPSIQAGRFTWLQVHPTTAGVFLGIGVLISVAFCLEARAVAGSRHPGWWPWPYVVAAVVDAGALYINHTRGVIAGVLVALLVMTVIVRPRRRRNLLVLAMVWGAALVGLVLRQSLLAYVARGESLQTLSTLNDRTSLWTIAYEAIKQKPLFGYGLYASRGIFVDSTGLGGAHNSVVNVAVDLGLVGLVLWAVLLISLLTQLIRFPRNLPPTARLDRSLMLGILTFLFVDGLSIAGIGAVANVASLWLYLMIGWTALAMRQSRVRSQRVSAVDGVGR